MTIQGQDLAQWLHQSLLRPVLEAGEVIGPIGKATCDGPIAQEASGRVFGLFTGMRWPGKVGESDGDAFVVFTSARILLLPGFIYRGEFGQQNIVYGLTSVRWSAIARINVPSEALSGEKRYLNLHFRDPHQTNAMRVLKLGIWIRDDGIATQRDFFDRAAAVAQERVHAAQVAGLPTPPRLWEVLSCEELNDRPDIVAIGAARRAARDAAQAETRARRYSPKNLHRVAGVAALALALGAAAGAQSQWSEHLDAEADMQRTLSWHQRYDTASSPLSAVEREGYRRRDEFAVERLRGKSARTMTGAIGLAVSVLPLAALGVWLLVRSRRLPAVRARWGGNGSEVDRHPGRSTSEAHT